MSTKPTAEEILSAYRPENKPIEIVLPTGGSMTFKPVTSTAERRKLVGQVADFMNSIPERGTPGWKAHPLKDLWPKDVEDQTSALLLHFRALDPPISQVTAFGYLGAPELLSHIETQLAIADKEIGALIRTRVLEESKKKSQTRRSATASEPVVEHSRASTPTT